MIPEAALPFLYAPWLRAIAGGPIAAETQATCDHCAMLPSPDSPPEATYFYPATKCCTCQPNIPNFLAGRILSDLDPSIAEGRRALEQRIATRVAVTPSRVGAGGAFELLYGSIPFGRAPALRCRYLTPEGGCGVWTHRPGVCATWFCKHVRGATGLRFWKLAGKLLREVEQDLALWCLAELRAGSGEVGELAPQAKPDVSELDGKMDWPRYRKLWGEWAGREIAFYQACAGLVEPLRWEQVEQVCGPRVRILAELARDAYAHLGSEAIPERLRLGEFRVTGAKDGTYRVTAYHPYDPLLMAESLARVLCYFDGRPTQEALEAILVEQGIRLNPSLIRRMVDFGILTACEPEKSLLPVLS